MRVFAHIFALVAIMGCAPEPSVSEPDIWERCRDPAVREPGENHADCRARLCDAECDHDPECTSWEACTYGTEYPPCEPPFPATLHYTLIGYGSHAKRITEDDLIGSYTLGRRWVFPSPRCDLSFRVRSGVGTLTVEVSAAAGDQRYWTGSVVATRPNGPSETFLCSLTAYD